MSKDPILFAGGDTNLYGYVLQDPVNLIDRTGKNWGRVVVGALAAICFGLDFYDMYDTAKDLRELDGEIASTKNKIAELESQMDSGQNCPNDADEQIAGLEQNFLNLQQKRASAAGKGTVSGLGIAAVCAGIIKAAGG